ncbi:MAG: leucine-rich repeat domain-containing protein [Clostridia bacterium]|nr:leucine-rich repeat domain-containing protein [Clostridia bacterium]
MKKMFAMLLALMCCMSAFAVLAEDYSTYTTEELLAMSAAINAELEVRRVAARVSSPVEDFGWASDGAQVQINEYVGPGGDVVIPDEIDGLPVTKIGAKAFYNNQTLASVTLPSGLKEVGDQAFFLAKGLTGVLYLPASVEVLGTNAFTNTSYTGLVINSGYRQSGSDPFTMPELTFVYIREGVSPDIGMWAFQHCSKLEMMIIPASVTSFNQFALRDLAKLKIITPAGSAAEAFAMERFIPVETESYEQVAAQYNALYPMPE